MSTTTAQHFVWQGQINGKAQYRAIHHDWTRRLSNYDLLLKEFVAVVNYYARMAPVTVSITMERTDITTIICAN